MASMMVLTTLCAFIGFYFVFSGVIKITPVVHRDMHRETRRIFVSFAKVLPLASFFDTKLLPKRYRLSVGIVEMVAGFILGVVVPGKLKKMANIALILVNLLMIHGHVMTGNKFESTAPSLVFLIMLSCGFFLQWKLPNNGKATTGTSSVIEVPPTDSKRKKTE